MLPIMADSWTKSVPSMEQVDLLKGHAKDIAQQLNKIKKDQ
jgi:hypothetical protein